MCKLMLGFSLLALLGGGCKKNAESSETVAEQRLADATGASVELSAEAGTLAYRDDAGNTLVIEQTAKLPEAWPASIPVYPNGQMVSSMSGGSGKTAQMNVSFTTDDPPKTVLAFYATQLDGFKKASELVSQENYIVSYEGDDRVLGITATRGEEPKTLLTLTVSSQVR